MTLLFFLRSTNGSVAPAPGNYEEESEEDYKKLTPLDFASVETIEKNKRYKRNQEEELLLLLIKREVFDN